jgi:DNA-binding Lrp family transcriptional regulator
MLDLLTPLQRRLLDEFQRDLPAIPKPFAWLGDKLGLSEAGVIDELRLLQSEGIISRVGATVRPNTAGASTLAAVAAPDGRIEEIAAIISAEPGVNHSYLREDAWNLWFVATAPDEAELRKMLDRIAERSGLPVLDLRLVRAFNIDLGFRLSGAERPQARRAVRMDVLTAADRPLLQALSAGLPLVPRPFTELAAQQRTDEASVLRRISSLVEANIITRLGVIVRHRAIGWTANAMVVWEIPEDRVVRAGEAVAAHPGVSLCYQRRTVPGAWPFGLFNMIHARTRQEALDVLGSLKNLPELADARHRVLFSTHCFKQTGALIHRQEIAA